MTMLLIALGAGVGAPARYLTDRAIRLRVATVFPWGTLTVNVIASLILGILLGAGARLNTEVVQLLGTGFCGALSTYSAFSYQTLRLSQRGARSYAAANVLLSLVAGLAAAGLGWWLGCWLG